MFKFKAWEAIISGVRQLSDEHYWCNRNEEIGDDGQTLFNQPQLPVLLLILSI